QYSKWDFEVWQDGIKVHAKQLTTTPYSVPAYTLNSTNSISVRVRTIKSVNGYTSTTDYVSLNVSGLTSIAPSIKDFTIDQDNADYAVTIIPNVSGATSYEWVVGDAYGENYITGQGLTIPANTMSKGNNDITLIAAAMTSTGGYVYSKKIKVFALRHDEPEIYALEPADLDINVTNNVPVTFTTNEFVDSWELEVAGIKVTGTTARKHIVTPNIFIKGTNTLRLTAVYRSSRKVSKTVTFNGYGKPSTPKLAGTEVENSSRPVFTWSIPTTTDSDEQVAYHIIIKKGNVVVEDKTVTSISKRHQTIATLGNNTAYIAYLTIKNKYNIWSDVGTRKFTTSFGDNLPDIDLELYENNGSVLITPILSDVTPDFSDVVIFRKEKNEWVLLADNINYDESVIDYSLKKDTEVSYKVRYCTDSLEPSYKDSHEKKITVKSMGFTFTNAKNFEESFSTLFVKSSIGFATNKVQKVFANAKAPVIYKDKLKYATIPLTVTLHRSEIDTFTALLENNVILYRDMRGNKYYVDATIMSIEALNNQYSQLSVQLVETRFDETGMFSKPLKSLEYTIFGIRR
ncbi:MAG: hypothetical protein RR289_10435, partial [Niameybacter sp.]